MVEKLTEGYRMSVSRGRQAIVSLALSLISGGSLAQESTDATLPPEDNSATAYEAPPAEAAPESAEVSPASDASAPAEEAASSDTIAVEPIAAPEQPEPELQAAPTGEEPVQLEEIVVTARKRVETIQNVPLSVTAFSAKNIEQRGYVGLEDLASATPGFTFEPFMTGGAHANPVIRGLASQFTTTRVQNVSFFLDGVYLQRQSMLNLGMIDMERIEIVKGPQNALYGRNAFAGAVNYVTLQPSADALEGYVSMGMGDNDRQERRASLAGPVPFIQGLVAKATYGASSYDGHTKNNHPVADADPSGPNLRGMLGGRDDNIYSLSLGYEPTDALKIRTSFYKSHEEHETGPGYSISGVRAARFGLRFDYQNDLNCNVASVPDIQPQPPRTHTGFTAYCGELPRYASDTPDYDNDGTPEKARLVDGIVVDPRAIGSLADTKAMTMSLDYDLNDDWTVHYLFGKADHQSYTDGGASDEDPIAGRGINVDASMTQCPVGFPCDTQNPDAYQFVNTASSRPNSELKSYSHELRFDWQYSDALRSSFGIYYSKVQDEEWTALFLNDLCNGSSAANIRNCNTPLSAANSLDAVTVQTAAPAYDQYVRQHGGKLRGEWTAFQDEIKSAFLSVNYQFRDNLEGTLEGRLNVEDKTVDRFADAFMLAPGTSICYGMQGVSCTAAPGRTIVETDKVLPVANTITSTISKPHDEASFTNFTPRAIINWGFAPQRMLYASAAKGAKSGGFNNAISEAELTFDEEENWTYELGSKNSFFDRALTLNGVIYLIEQSTLQGGVPPSVGALSTSDIITNIGGATSKGFELEANYRFTDALSLDLAYSNVDPRYTQGTKFSAGRTGGSTSCDGVTCPSDGDISGNQLSRTSKRQWSAGLNYVTFLRGFTVNGRLDTNYQSRQFVEPLNLAWVPERQLTNASLNFISPGASWEMGLWGKNLTNEDYAANSFFIGVFNQYMVGKGAARTYGANVKYKF